MRPESRQQGIPKSCYPPKDGPLSHVVEWCDCACHGQASCPCDHEPNHLTYKAFASEAEVKRDGN